MGKQKGRILKSGVSLAVVGLSLAGCASVDTAKVIKPGDRVAVSFDCRLPDGAMAVSTDVEAVSGRTGGVSNVFMARGTGAPLELKAGGDPAYAEKSVTSFEEDVMQGIAVALPGWKEGELRTVNLASAASPNGQLRLARVRHADKELRLSVEDFRSKTGKEPEKGQVVYMESELPGVVKEVGDGTVLIGFSAVDGAAVRTPLGPATVRDAGAMYDIVIDAKQGELMRMGPLVGRIAFADERNIDLDFSRTFGGTDLRCDVKVENIKAAVQEPATVAPVGGVPEKPQANGPSADEVTQGVSILQKAVADAVKEGKVSVNLDTDAVSPVAKGDLVTVRFSARDAKGELLLLPGDMAKQDTPQEIIAGNEEVFPGLGDAVVGMAAGEKKRLTLPPEKAFGPRSPANMAFFPLQSTVPARISLAADEYVRRFGGFPVAGKEVPLVPHLTAKVAEIGEKDVTLAVSATDGAQFDEPFGTVTVHAGKDNLTMKVSPRLGGKFRGEAGEGVVSAVDSEKFTVDFNHPLAGRTIVVDLEVLGVTRAAGLKRAAMRWIEDHDAGLAEAKREGKPLFLLLYADWCKWCQKTEKEALTDPRIGELGDKFVWMRINSDKEKKYKLQYGQDGFPMMVILRPDGTVLKKIDGYRDPSRLAAELKAVL